MQYFMREIQGVQWEILVDDSDRRRAQLKTTRTKQISKASTTFNNYFFVRDERIITFYRQICRRGRHAERIVYFEHNLAHIVGISFGDRQYRRAIFEFLDLEFFRRHDLLTLLVPFSFWLWFSSDLHFQSVQSRK